MGVFKCKETGTWYVMTRYRDWKGERKQKCKRGFATKRAAQDWEQKFHMQNAADMDMTFEAFYEIYTKDMKARLKENSWITKQNIVETKILPYFGQRKISEITTKDVIAWQNEQLAYRDEKHKPYPCVSQIRIAAAKRKFTSSSCTVPLSRRCRVSLS